jgi:hypothetical protein
MTMTDMKCDVCGVNPPIGVASTIIPYSCAYCKECAERNAQPEIVFLAILDDIKEAGRSSEDVDDAIITFKNGRYMSFKEWAEIQ